MTYYQVIYAVTNNSVKFDFNMTTFNMLRDPYVIALRSVTLPTHPPTEGFNRGEVVCAGFTIYAVSESVSKVGHCNIKHLKSYSLS